MDAFLLGIHPFDQISNPTTTTNPSFQPKMEANPVVDSSDDESEPDEELERDLEKVYAKMKEELKGMTGGDMGSDIEEEREDPMKYKTKNEIKNLPGYFEEEDPLKRNEKMGLPIMTDIDKLIEIGKIHALLPDFILIEGAGEVILNLDNILLVNKDLILGVVDDVFGNVKKPFYRVVLDKLMSKMVGANQLTVGMSVYAIDKVKKVVHTMDIVKMMKTKGCDASNKFDEENLGDDDRYYSDDDAEIASKANKKHQKKKEAKERKMIERMPKMKRKEYQHRQQNSRFGANNQRMKLAYNPFVPREPSLYQAQPTWPMPSSFGNTMVQQQPQQYQQPLQQQQPFQYNGGNYQPYSKPPPPPSTPPPQNGMSFTTYFGGQQLQQPRGQEFYAPLSSTAPRMLPQQTPQMAMLNQLASMLPPPNQFQSQQNSGYSLFPPRQ